jgi:hypothetical protein
MTLLGLAVFLFKSIYCAGFQLWIPLACQPSLACGYLKCRKLFIRFQLLTALHTQGVCWRVPRSFAATLPRTRSEIGSPPVKGELEGVWFKSIHFNFLTKTLERRW